MAARFVLFSPFSPLTGGGGANLRSLLRHIPDVEVEWCYTADKPVEYPRSTWLGKGLSGGKVWSDLPRFASLWLGHRPSRFRSILELLAARNADGYWIVGHHEGVLHALELIKRGFRVHLTAQDDLPDGVLARSIRYRAVAPLARAPFYRTLRMAHSIDVTSTGMQAYYRRLLRLESTVVHPIADGPLVDFAGSRDDGELTFGHLGNLYSITEWFRFLDGLIQVAARRGQRPRMLMIGLSAKYRDIPVRYREMVEFHPELPETQAIELLGACNAVYAMYPFDARARIFRETSLPTKLSTYVRCGRPIFAHTPEDSTLAEMVRTHGLGSVCETLEASGIEASIESVMTSPPDRAAFRAAIEHAYGAGNARSMLKLLMDLPVAR